MAWTALGHSKFTVVGGTEAWASDNMARILEGNWSTGDRDVVLDDVWHLFPICDFLTLWSQFFTVPQGLVSTDGWTEDDTWAVAGREADTGQPQTA